MPTNSTQSRKLTSGGDKDELELFNTLFDSSPVAQVVLTTSGEILHCNDATADLLGMKNSRLIGKSLADNVEKNDVAEIARHLSRCGFGEKRIRSELRLKGKNSPLPVELISTMLRPDSSGRSICNTVIYDRSKEFIKENERLKTQKLESLGRFAAELAHRYNNLLTAVIGNISLAKIYSKPNDKGLRNLNFAEEAAEKAHAITQELVTFSDGGTPVRRPHSATSILKDVVEKSQLSEKLKFEFRIPDNLYTVDVDKRQIFLVINNLLKNGDEAMPEGGCLLLKAENISIDSRDGIPVDNGNYVKITVIDDGVGIPSDKISKIFDPFYSTKTDRRGLGLSGAYSIVRNHNGFIKVDSSPGSGSSFVCYIPAATECGAPDSATDSADNDRMSRILLVDDEEFIRDVARQIIEEIGHKVDCVCNGFDAVKKYRSAIKVGDPYDIVILDLTMNSGKGGLEIFRELLEINPEIRALVSSGYSHSPIMSKYKHYGFSGVLAKPYKFDEMRNGLRKVISSG